MRSWVAELERVEDESSLSRSSVAVVFVVHPDTVAKGYPIGIKYTNKQVDALPIIRHDFHASLPSSELGPEVAREGLESDRCRGDLDPLLCGLIGTRTVDRVPLRLEETGLSEGELAQMFDLRGRRAE